MLRYRRPGSASMRFSYWLTLYLGEPFYEYVSSMKQSPATGRIMPTGSNPNEEYEDYEIDV